MKYIKQLLLPLLVLLMLLPMTMTTYNDDDDVNGCQWSIVLCIVMTDVCRLVCCRRCCLRLLSACWLFLFLLCSEVPCSSNLHTKLTNSYPTNQTAHSMQLMRHDAACIYNFLLQLFIVSCETSVVWMRVCAMLLLRVECCWCCVQIAAEFLSIRIRVWERLRERVIEWDFVVNTTHNTVQWLPVHDDDNNNNVDDDFGDDDDDDGYRRSFTRTRSLAYICLFACLPASSACRCCLPACLPACLWIQSFSKCLYHVAIFLRKFNCLNNHIHCRFLMHSSSLYHSYMHHYTNRHTHIPTYIQICMFICI